MFKKILYFVVFTFVIFVIIGFLLPRKVHVERSIEIERPTTTVFMLLNGFDSFESWSPWVEKDPDAQYQYDGPESGVGARMSWSGDPRMVGTGWQEITESRPYSLVRMHLDFDQQGEADAYFQIDRAQSGTRLTWGFDTDLVEGQGIFGGLLARYFGLFFDQWIGGDYEQGLANFKRFAESLPVNAFEGLELEIMEVEPMDILFVSSNSSRESTDIASSLATAYREITAFMAETGIEMTSQPMTITRAWDERGFEFDAAIPVEKLEVELRGNVQAGRSPAGRAVRLVYRGPYDQMGPSYEKLAAYMAAHGLKEGPVSWEHYISDPGVTPTEEVITHIYFLIDDES